jgi:hypothetical protein
VPEASSPPSLNLILTASSSTSITSALILPSDKNTVSVGLTTLDRLKQSTCKTSLSEGYAKSSVRKVHTSSARNSQVSLSLLKGETLISLPLMSIIKAQVLWGLSRFASA